MSENLAEVYVAEDGEHIAFGVPFSKIDIKDRTVEGFATLDNVDKAFDIVDFKASEEAFADWIGNIREMHGTKAVGKAIQIESKVLEKDGKKYNGIWVKSRISKGAQDTWEKILDGTLSGYSIGGKILERKPEVVKNEGKFSQARVNRITKYMLAELSVVDNPMNPLALFDGVAKGMLIKNDSDGLVAGEILGEEKGLFYCNTCDIAKLDDFNSNEVECVTCDSKMSRIGDVFEVPTSDELKKMLTTASEEALNKVNVSVDVVESDGESGFGHSGEWKPSPEIEDVEHEQVNVPTGTPQDESPAPHAKAEVSEDTLAAQTAESEETIDVTIKHKGGYIDPRAVAQKVFEALKSRGESTGRSIVDKSDEMDKMITQENGKYCVHSKDGSRSFGCYGTMEQAKARLAQIETFKRSQQEEADFVSSLLDPDLFRVGTYQGPLKGYPKNEESYADKTNFRFPINSPGSIRSSLAIFNSPGQRKSSGYSMREWSDIGKSLVIVANEVLGEGHELHKGKIIGILYEADAEKAEFIVNLQKNSSNANNDMIHILSNLVGNVEDDSAIIKGGETQTLDVKELEKILDILDTATREIGEVVKGFSAQGLNNEDASGSSVGANDPGEAGVGTSQENDGGAALSATEVTVADETSLPGPDNGPDKVSPDAIDTDATGAHEGITADSGPEKVLPHAELAAATAKADETEETKEAGVEDLLKTFVEKIETSFDSLNERLSAVENSGGMKKSVEVEGTELKKSDTPFWGNIFSADELTQD